MKIETKFDIGQKVYHKTDPNQEPWLIRNICIFSKDSIEYEVAKGEVTTFFSEHELSDEIDELIKLGLKWTTN